MNTADVTKKISEIKQLQNELMTAAMPLLESVARNLVHTFCRLLLADKAFFVPRVFHGKVYRRFELVKASADFKYLV